MSRRCARVSGAFAISASLVMFAVCCLIFGLTAPRSRQAARGRSLRKQSHWRHRYLLTWARGKGNLLGVFFFEQLVTWIAGSRLHAAGYEYSRLQV